MHHCNPPGQAEPLQKGRWSWYPSSQGMWQVWHITGRLKRTCMHALSLCSGCGLALAWVIARFMKWSVIRLDSMYLHTYKSSSNPILVSLDVPYTGNVGGGFKFWSLVLFGNPPNSILIHIWSHIEMKVYFESIAYCVHMFASDMNLQRKVCPCLVFSLHTYSTHKKNSSGSG